MNDSNGVHEIKNLTKVNTCKLHVSEGKFTLLSFNHQSNTCEEGIYPSYVQHAL